MFSNIRELKQHLGPGLGLRKNRFLLELPVPTVRGETLSMLCQSAGLPERNINTTEMWHKGRIYTVRGEADFTGEYEISIVDDSNMEIRQMFDVWMRTIDDTRPDLGNRILASSFEEMDRRVLFNLRNERDADKFNQGEIAKEEIVKQFKLGLESANQATINAKYQLDINIWQMNRKHEKVYGYKLQNAFPKSIGTVTLEDDNENSLSEFSVVLAYSEFVPLKNHEFSF